MKPKSSIIIAGASEGIGATLSKKIINDNYQPVLLARQLEKLQAISDELENSNPEIKPLYYAVDLTDPLASQKVFNTIAEKALPITALINCAATWTGGVSVTDMDLEFLQRSMNLNFYTAFNSIKSLLSLPENTKTLPYTIVNLGATAAKRGGANMAAFATAKTALRTLSESLARELGPKKVHVVHLVIDGLIDNARTRHLSPNLPKEQFLDMQSIAKVVLDLIHQDESAWTFELDIRPFGEKW